MSEMQIAHAASEVWISVKHFPAEFLTEFWAPVAQELQAKLLSERHGLFTHEWKRAERLRGSGFGGILQAGRAEHHWRSRGALGTFGYISIHLDTFGYICHRLDTFGASTF